MEFLTSHRYFDSDDFNDDGYRSKTSPLPIVHSHNVDSPDISGEAYGGEGGAPPHRHKQANNFRDGHLDANRRLDCGMS